MRALNRFTERVNYIDNRPGRQTGARIDAALVKLWGRAERWLAETGTAAESVDFHASHVIEPGPQSSALIVLEVHPRGSEK